MLTRLVTLLKWAVLLSVMAWGMGLMFFYIKISRDLPPATNVPKAGVVFTGSAGRIKTGLRLLNTGTLNKLLISSIRHGGPKAYQNDARIMLDTGARNTYENVCATSAWALQEKIHTITLITADYHMPRALTLAKRYAPQLSCAPFPVKTSFGKRLQKGFWEYHKLLATFFIPCWNRCTRTA